MNHGETLRKIRVLNGLSQEYVASKLGINQASYSEWERKDIISAEKLTRIFNVLEITTEDFEGFTNEFSQAKTKKAEENSAITFLLNIVAQQTEIIKRMVEQQSGERKK